MDLNGLSESLKDRLGRAFEGCDNWELAGTYVSTSDGSLLVNVQFVTSTFLGEDLYPTLEAEGDDLDSAWAGLAGDALVLWENFDPERHAVGWYEASEDDRHSKVPGSDGSLRGLIEDAEEIKTRLEELYDTIVKG